MSLTASHLVKTYKGGKRAVDDVSIRVAPGDFVAIVGESGSGKSTTARIMLNLLKPDSGSLIWKGQDVAAMDRDGVKDFRAKVQAIFQDPSGALNPRKRIRNILGEVTAFYGIATRAEAIDAHSRAMLERVGLSPAEIYMNRFPHELSGGQRQRVLIARSMIPEPEIIIADEAVSALDVSVKAGVLRLMENLRRDSGVGYLLISHDLAVVRKVATHVYVMANGKVVEEGPTAQIFENPQHPYTRTLLGAAMDLDAVLAERAARQGEDRGGVNRPLPCLAPLPQPDQ